jgi:hypothetical protein
MGKSVGCAGARVGVWGVVVDRRAEGGSTSNTLLRQDPHFLRASQVGRRDNLGSVSDAVCLLDSVEVALVRVDEDALEQGPGVGDAVGVKFVREGDSVGKLADDHARESVVEFWERERETFVVSPPLEGLRRSLRHGLRRPGELPDPPTASRPGTLTLVG